MPFLLFYGNLNPMGLDPRLLRLIKPHGRLFAATIALGLAIGVLTICQARVLSHVISQVFLYEETLVSISKLLVWLLIILLARAGMIWTGEVIAKHLANRIKSDLRHQLLNHIQSLGPVYVGHERSGELTHLATEGIEALDAYFSQFLPQFILALFVPLTFLLFIFPLDVLSALVMLLTAPLIPIFMILIGNMKSRNVRGTNRARMNWGRN
jgi:ATP-binding cassette subfamily C protein CydD